MPISDNIKPISYLKANTAELIAHLKTRHQPMIITQNGAAAMVIQSVADYGQTQETLALPKLLMHSQQAVGEGKTVTSSKAFAKLRQRHGLLSSPCSR